MGCIPKESILHDADERIHQEDYAFPHAFPYAEDN